ncbi:MAG: DUF120 domain-containing protein [Halobacteria archaeon]
MTDMEGLVAVKPDELQTLKELAVRGAVEKDVKISCRELADEIGTSDQTVSRRLQALENKDLIDREMTNDGQWINTTQAGEDSLRKEYEKYRKMFEQDRGLTLKGSLVTGMGEGEYYISREGYMRQFREKLGYEPYPGTLNLELTEESTRNRKALHETEGIEIEKWRNEERTFGAATCYPALIGSDKVEGHVIYPHRTHYPDEMLELISETKLIDALELEGGDTLELEVQI